MLKILISNFDHEIRKNDFRPFLNRLPAFAIFEFDDLLLFEQCESWSNITCYICFHIWIIIGITPLKAVDVNVTPNSSLPFPREKEPIQRSRLLYSKLSGAPLALIPCSWYPSRFYILLGFDWLSFCRTVCASLHHVRMSLNKSSIQTGAIWHRDKFNQRDKVSSQCALATSTCHS